jgi:Ca-activated chloride channel family protein
MTFAHPAILALAPIAVAVIWWLVRRRRQSEGFSSANIHRRWADARGLSDRPAASRRRFLRGVCLAAGALAALVALARPQWGEVPEQTFDQSREVLLALDLSRSMLADDVSPTRLARAKLLIESLLDELRGERVGLVVFAGTAFTQSPLSADYEVLRDFLAELDPSYLPQGGSNYDAMLQTALQAFGQQGAGDRFLVVLSDGEAHDENWKSRLAALRAQDIKVIGLGIGTPAGALVVAANGGVLKDEQGNAVLSRLESGTLEELARETGGTYRDAATWVDIAALVDATVAQGRTGQYVEERRVRLQDRFQWFLAPALILMMLSLWIDFPLSPLARARQLRGRRPHPASSPALAAALMALVAWQAASPARAAVSEAPPPPGAAALQPNPLETTVAELVAKPVLGATDYARLATDTIGFAAQPDAPKGAPRSGVIDDALAAVDRGEHIDANAADWPALRAELERLKNLEEEPPPAQEEQPREQQPQPQQNGQGGDQEQQQQGGGSGNEQQEQNANNAGSGGEKNDDRSSSADATGGGETRESESGDSQNRAEAEDSGSTGADQQQQDTAKDAGEVERADEVQPLEAAEAGLGEAEKPESKPDTAAVAPVPSDPEPQHQPRQPESRMVGGGPALKGIEPQGDLALTEALGRMEQVKEGDAPAVLFDRMNRSEGQPPHRNSKDW